uniref:OCRE domain-containing protein n=1 Tax=Trichuris muris TaxID=70415 RepID=A0A5S6QJV9_TRIMR
MMLMFLSDASLSDFRYACRSTERLKLRRFLYFLVGRSVRQRLTVFLARPNLGYGTLRTGIERAGLLLLPQRVPQIEDSLWKRWRREERNHHTSNGYNYYTDVTGRYYAHDEEGQWYIQDAKGRFILWTAPEDMSNAVATKDEAPTKSGNAIQTAIAEEPMANQCVEMEICGDDDLVVDADANKPTNDNDVTAAKGTDLQQADEPKELHQAALQSTSHGSTNLGGVKGSAGLTTQWEEYSRQYYQQYGYMPTYEMFSDGTASGGGQAFSNAGWIVTGGRRTKVRPEDIDLPPGPPPSASTGDGTPTGRNG